MRAFTRAVSSRLPECQLTHLDRVPIDAARAAGQHAAYERAPVEAGCLILPAGNPRSAELLRNRGFDVVEVAVSELQKAESGVTCMSLIDDRSQRRKSWKPA